MSDPETWCREQWVKLKNEELRDSALDDIKNHLSSIPSFEASIKAKLLDLPRIFEFLNSSNPKQINTACEVLEICFSNLAIGYVASNARDDILKALGHESVAARQLAIFEVHRTVHSNSKLIPLPEYLDIAIAVVRCIGDDDLKVSTRAMDIVSREDWLQYPQIVKELKSILEHGNSSSRCKCYEVIVNISKKSSEHLEVCAQEGLVHKIFSELKTQDVLLQLNILELLTNLALTPYGLKFLVQNEVLKSLSELVGSLGGNPTANLVIPGLMKFFGNVAHTYPTEIFVNFPTVVDALFDTIKSNNTAVLPVALETLAFVGCTYDGKLALGALGHVLISAISEIGGYIKNSPTEIRVRALYCAANLISIKDVPMPIDPRITLMTREWFRELSERPTSMEIIFQLSKNPFPELKLGAFAVLSAVCQHLWGEELVMSTPGLIEFLLDRSADHQKDSKHAKYEIISQLSKSCVFEVDTILRLKSYVEEGPFYVQGVTEVAIEGD